MRDAVADLVRDGDTVAIEGFTNLICFAAGHEIIRQRKRVLDGAGNAGGCDDGAGFGRIPRREILVVPSRETAVVAFPPGGTEPRI